MNERITLDSLKKLASQEYFSWWLVHEKSYMDTKRHCLLFQNYVYKKIKQKSSEYLLHVRGYSFLCPFIVSLSITQSICDYQVTTLGSWLPLKTKWFARIKIKSSGMVTHLPLSHLISPQMLFLDEKYQHKQKKWSIHMSIIFNRKKLK